ncbi:TerB family tellurite resistance protein [Coleofasciculus sp. E2-BRE-01]|uniref:TerB family tellurite resistance protein n=1 Tax=Coleofasciculus sp. E2-BRE-01 TaxID=3069524 RepID=UPI0032FDA8D7
MDTALVSPEAVALLSRITGQKLSQRQLTPPVIFLAALVTVLLGVMFADGTVTDEEKQQLQAILDNLTPSGSKLRKLAQLLLKGVKQHQVYTKLDQLTTLTIPLSEAEKLLVISFGYKMLANTRGINSRETSYLESLTNQLGVNSKYLAVLEAGFNCEAS